MLSPQLFDLHIHSIMPHPIASIIGVLLAIRDTYGYEVIDVIEYSLN